MMSFIIRQILDLKKNISRRKIGVAAITVGGFVFVA